MSLRSASDDGAEPSSPARGRPLALTVVEDLCFDMSLFQVLLDVDLGVPEVGIASRRAPSKASSSFLRAANHPQTLAPAAMSGLDCDRVPELLGSGGDLPDRGDRLGHARHCRHAKLLGIASRGDLVAGSMALAGGPTHTIPASVTLANRAFLG